MAKAKKESHETKTPVYVQDAAIQEMAGEVELEMAHKAQIEELEEEIEKMEVTGIPLPSIPFELRPDYGFILVTREGHRQAIRLQRTMSVEEIAMRFRASKDAKDAPPVTTVELVSLIDEARAERTRELEERGIYPDTSAPERVTCSVQVSRACPKDFQPMVFLNGKAGSFVRRDEEGMDPTILGRAREFTASVNGGGERGVILSICGKCRNFIKHLVFDEEREELRPLLRASTLDYLLGKAKQAEESAKLLSTLVSKETRSERKSPKNQPFREALGGGEFLSRGQRRNKRW